jgi:hypothetical protein
MAYGHKQDEGSERRAADLGRAPATPELLRLRALCIGAKNAYSRAIWPASLFDPMPHGKALDAAMLALQAGFKGTLNSVWAEKCRMEVKRALPEQRKRGVACLFGKFKHVGSVGEKPLKDGTRRLLNLPEEWSRKLSDADVAALASLAEDMNAEGMLALFRKLRLGKKTALPPLHGEALLAMLAEVEERYGCPEWKDGDATVQLHIDFRCMIGGKETCDAVLACLTDALLQAKPEKVEGTDKPLKPQFTFPLLFSGVKAYGSPLVFAASVMPDVVKSIKEAAGAEAGKLRFKSLILELGPKESVVRGVVVHSPKPLALAEAFRAVGLDWGYTNTVAISVVQLEQALDPAFFEACAGWSKAEAREYLSTHWSDAEPLFQKLHCGMDFQKAVQRHCLRIDAYNREINRAYGRLFDLRREIQRIVGADTGHEAVDLGMATCGHALLAKLLARFGKLLVSIRRMKKKRRAEHRAIDGVKKSWFGWLTTEIARLARKHGAVVLKEALSLKPLEKEDPAYKGRTFNKRMTNGSRAQFDRLLGGKLRLYGIPLLEVPCAYTSQTDVRFAAVDRRQRKKQSVFVALADGRRTHADLNACHTISLYGSLRKGPPPRMPSTQEL